MIGPLISAGASLLGGFLQRGAQQDANAANAEQARLNMNAQREFAQNSVLWRTQDAERAGVHPVYALGAPGMNFSPVQVGATAESGVGTALQSMGQDLSRSVGAYRPPSEKVAAIGQAQQVASNALDLDTKKVNLEILRAKLAAMGPGMPPGVNFEVPENKKIEERPPLMAAGSRWLTNPNTSPQKAWADQYGDEGPMSWLTSIGIGLNDAKYNLNKRTWANTDDFERGVSGIPGQVLRWYQQAKNSYYNKSHPLPERPTYRHERR